MLWRARFHTRKLNIQGRRKNISKKFLDKNVTGTPKSTVIWGMCDVNEVT